MRGSTSAPRSERCSELGTWSVLWRLGVSAAVLTTVVLGTAVGNDQWWPFAPMSQYAFAVSNDGVVNSLGMDALTEDGTVVRVPLSKEALGIERAEIEGQLPRFTERPELLQAIADLHAKRLPDEPRYTVLWLRNTSTQIPTGAQTVVTLATWEVR